MPRLAAIVRHQPLLVATATSLAVVFLLLAPDYTLFDGYDWVRMHIFYKEYYRDTLLQGSLPWWNPYVGLGRPFLADVETASLYPPNLLFLAGPGAGLILSLLFHFTLLIGGGVHLARRLGCRRLSAWFASLGFALGAPVIGRLQSGQFQVFCTLCWLPLLFLAGRTLLDRPSGYRATQLAAVFAVMFLAGSPPMLWVAGWGLILWLTAQLLLRPWLTSVKTVGWLAIAGSLSAGLAAVQLLPFLELIGEGNRPLHDTAFALANPQQIESWLSLALSRPPGTFFYWEYNLYCGLPLFLLFLLFPLFWREREMAVLLITAGVFAALATGPGLGLLRLLTEHAPGWAAFRCPSRYAIITMFCGALVAACVLDRIIEPLQRFHIASLSLAEVSATFFLGINVAENIRALHQRAAAYSHQSPMLEEASLVAGLASRTAPGAAPARVLAPPWILRENSGLRYRYSTLSSFANPALARVWDAIHIHAATPANPLDQANLPIALYTTPLAQWRGLGLQAEWDNSSHSWQYERWPEPRVYLATSWRAVTDWRTANRTAEVGHPHAKNALVEGLTPEDMQLVPGNLLSAMEARALITCYQPERMEILCSASVLSLLIIAEPWYPGWRAMVDGHDAPLHPANGWMRGVFVPPGRHQVVLYFRSRWAAAGALITGLALGVAFILTFRHRRASRSLSTYP